MEKMFSKCVTYMVCYGKPALLAVLIIEPVDTTPLCTPAGVGHRESPLSTVVAS